MADAPSFEIDSFLDHIQTDALPHTVIVDCTSDESIARRYVEWLRRGIHVVTPNKKAGSSDLDYYDQLRGASREGSAHYLYETTVGAGLPIIQTLRDLIQTGDEVLRVRRSCRVRSPICSTASTVRVPFLKSGRGPRQRLYRARSARRSVRHGRRRKVVILARRVWAAYRAGRWRAAGLVPTGPGGGQRRGFPERVTRSPTRASLRPSSRRASAARSALHRVDRRDGRASVRLRRRTRLGRARLALHLTDNIVQFSTARYNPNPLIVQGPGAGPEVDGAGVFADLLRLAAYLGVLIPRFPARPKRFGNKRLSGRRSAQWHAR